MTKQELLELIGTYGGLRDEAGWLWGGTEEYNDLADVAMKESLLVFERIAKELDKLYE